MERFGRTGGDRPSRPKDPRRDGQVPIASVTDELLRWATPVLHFRRTVAMDTEFSGQQMQAGDWIAMHYLSANRDEAVFDTINPVGSPK